MFGQSTQKKKSQSSSLKKSIFVPEDYQELGIQWIIDNPFCGLFYDPGLGKTATTLFAFDYLQREGLVDSMLVVATKRIALNVWPREVAKWQGLDMSIGSIMGDPSKRLKAMKFEADIYTTNYENLVWLADNWKHNNFGRCMLVSDESTKLKHTNTKRFRAIRKHLGKFERRVILTGTPIPNGMEDLFGQMFVVDLGKRLGRYITSFRNEYFHPAGYKGYDWQLNAGADDLIYDVISDVIHRVDDSVLDLPPLIVRDRKVSLSRKAWRTYNEMEREFILELEGGLVTALNAASKSSKLRQIANGAVYETPDTEDLDDTPKNEKRKVLNIHDEKVEEAVELIKEQHRPCLIAFEFTHDRVRLAKAIMEDKELAKRMPKNDKGQHYVPYISGGVSDKEADKLIDWWNQGVLPVLLGHPDSIAHGLNLQDIPAVVIYFSLGYNLENHEQFYRRVYRKGQEHSVYVFRLVCENTIDEDIVDALERKDLNQTTMLDALKKRHGM